MLLQEQCADLPAWVLDKLRSSAVPVSAAKVQANGHHPALREDERADIGAHWLDKALDKVTTGEYRNPMGYWLACQLRDAGMAEGDASLWMEVYAFRVPTGDHPYTESEALASLRSAYAQPPREPARRSGAMLYSRNAGNAGNNLEQAGEESNSAFNAFNEYPSRVFPEVDAAMFTGVAGDIVAAIEPHTEASPVALLAQLLVSAGNAAGRHVYYVHEADRHYANLFVALVGETAKARKGTSWGHVDRVMRSADAEWAAKHIIGGLSSGEGIIHALRNVPLADIPLGDEGELLRDKRLLAREGEFASVLAQKARDGNILSMVLRDGWDGGTLGTLTKNSPERATDTHLSMIGHITQAELVKSLSSVDAHNGYANRFLFVATQRARLLPHGGDLEAIERATAPHISRLRQVLLAAREPRRIAHDADAFTLWEQEYERLSSGHPGLFGAVTARAEAQVTRLALVYALLDQARAITVEHLGAALALWRFCEASALYIFGDRLGDATADSILDALRTSGTNGLTRTALYEHFGHNTASSKIDSALGVLSAAGLARMLLSASTGEKGRPPERWVALRATQETQ